MKAHLSDTDAAANLGTAEHGQLEPSALWQSWAQVAQAVRHFWCVLSSMPIMPSHPLNAQTEAG
eukprot:1652170-Amphidinium_carterae.2